MECRNQGVAEIRSSALPLSSEYGRHMAHIRQSRPYKTVKAANVAHTRQSRPDSGLDFQARVLKTFQVVPSSLGSGCGRALTSVAVCIYIYIYIYIYIAGKRTHLGGGIHSCLCRRRSEFPTLSSTANVNPVNFCNVNPVNFWRDVRRTARVEVGLESAAHHALHLRV